MCAVAQYAKTTYMGNPARHARGKVVHASTQCVGYECLHIVDYQQLNVAMGPNCQDLLSKSLSNVGLVFKIMLIHTHQQWIYPGFRIGCHTRVLCFMLIEPCVSSVVGEARKQALVTLHRGGVH